MALRENVQKIENQSDQPTDQWSFSPYHNSHSQNFNFEEIELDIIEQLKESVFELGDLQSRLSFINDELEKVIGSHRKKL